LLSGIQIKPYPAKAVAPGKGKYSPAGARTFKRGSVRIDASIAEGVGRRVIQSGEGEPGVASSGNQRASNTNMVDKNPRCDGGKWAARSILLILGGGGKKKKDEVFLFYTTRE